MGHTMNPRYEPKTLEQKLGYLVEEAGEVLAAAGKTLRWGLRSVNPELPPEQQETNEAWLSRELGDLERAIGYVREELSIRALASASTPGAPAPTPVTPVAEQCPSWCFGKDKFGQHAPGCPNRAAATLPAVTPEPRASARSSGSMRSPKEGSTQITLAGCETARFLEAGAGCPPRPPSQP